MNVSVEYWQPYVCVECLWLCVVWIAAHTRATTRQQHQAHFAEQLAREEAARRAAAAFRARPLPPTLEEPQLPVCSFFMLAITHAASTIQRHINVLLLTGTGGPAPAHCAAAVFVA